MGHLYRRLPLLLSCLFFFAFTPSRARHGVRNFVEQTGIEVPKRLQEIIDYPVVRVERVDFDGDGKDDYICYTSYGEDDKAHEYWVRSDMEIVRRRSYVADVNETRFVHLDSAEAPAIIHAFGNPPDKISYVLMKMDWQKKKLDTLFFFIPVIIMNNHPYSAYIGGIEGVYWKQVRGRVPTLSCSFAHTLVHYRSKRAQAFQKSLPIVLFTGHGVEPLAIKKLPSTFSWKTIIEIRRKMRN